MYQCNKMCYRPASRARIRVDVLWWLVVARWKSETLIVTRGAAQSGVLTRVAAFRRARRKSKVLTFCH